LTADAPPPPGRSIRAFVALPLPDALRAGVAETVRRLKESLPEVRYVHDHGAHVTLRFLGWTNPEMLAALEGPLRAAAAQCPPVEMAVRGLGMFPERGSPRVLWMGLVLPAAVHALQARCEQAAVAVGLPPEERPFHPHLTLGRWRDRARRPTLPDADLGSAGVDRLVLYRSDLRSSGSVHTPVAEFPLAGSAGSVR
jgi:RNA 2',3'-cyclic 3'-phosphodiesterase